MLFVELKATGARPTPAQVRDHERRRENGAEVVWLDSKEGVDVLTFALENAWAVGTDKNFKVRDA